MPFSRWKIHVGLLVPTDSISFLKLIAPQRETMPALCKRSGDIGTTSNRVCMSAGSALKIFVVVTKTSERAENLATATSDVLREGARKHFLFTWSEKFSLEDPAPVIDNVYISARTAGTDCRHPLVPPPPLQPKPVE